MRRRLDARGAVRAPQVLGVVVGSGGQQRRRRGEAARAAARAREGRPPCRRPGRAGRMDRRGILLDDRARARPGAAARRGAPAERAQTPRGRPRPTHLPVGARSPTRRAHARAAGRAGAACIAALARRPPRAAAAARRHRLGQDRGLPARRRAALEQGRGAIVLVPEIALTPQIVGRFIERFGDDRRGAALAAAPGRALRGVAPPARGRGAGVRGAALGRVRADRGPRPDRRRRGARLLLQARGRPALRRARRRRRARASAAARCCCSGSATPRPESVQRLPARVLAAAGGRAPAAGGAGARHARARPRACIRSPRRRSPRCAPHAGRRSCCSTAAAGRTSSPAAPAGACGAARTATSRSCCTAPAGISRATTAGTASRRPRAAATAPPARSRGTGPAPSACSTSSRTCFDDGRFPVFRLDADAVGDGTDSGVGAIAAPLRGGRLRRADRHPDGRQGPRLPRRAASGWCSTRTRTLRFPDFRAEERTFALIAQLAGRAGRGRARARARADDRAGGALDRARGPPRQRRLPRRRARAPARAQLPAVLAPDQDRAVCRSSRRPRWRPAREVRARLSGSLVQSETSVLGPAALFRLRGRERHVLVVKAADRRAAVHAVGRRRRPRRRRALACGRELQRGRRSAVAHLF